MFVSLGWRGRRWERPKCTLSKENAHHGLQSLWQKCDSSRGGQFHGSWLSIETDEETLTVILCREEKSVVRMEGPERQEGDYDDNDQGVQESCGKKHNVVQDTWWQDEKNLPLGMILPSLLDCSLLLEDASVWENGMEFQHNRHMLPCVHFGVFPAIVSLSILPRCVLSRN